MKARLRRIKNNPFGSKNLRWCLDSYSEKERKKLLAVVRVGWDLTHFKSFWVVCPLLQGFMSVLFSALCPAGQ